jgi:hypothetical protein
MQEEIDRLERDIGLLSRALVFPQTPSLTDRVRVRIEQERLTSRAALLAACPHDDRRCRGRLAFVAGVLAPARDAVADLFDRVNIFETEKCRRT